MEVLPFPERNDVLESETSTAAVMFGVEFVLGAALLIQAARIPVAVLRLALRPHTAQMPNFASPKPFRH